MGIRNKKKDYDLLMPPSVAEEVNTMPKSPNFTEGYP
jgi:hypothetical protein